jgi:hypothetical protein
MANLEPRPDAEPALNDFARDLERVREPSYPLTFAVQRLAAPAADVHAALDAVAAAAGFQGIGSGWVEVPRRIAAKILAHLIGGELAYPAEVVPRAQAEELAGRFLALVPSPARYFTNGALSGDFAVYDLQGGEVLGWRSLSEAPYDNGIIAIGAERAAMLWAEDAP